METNKILTANLLDIVFDGRNKTYGAYELRSNYERRMLKALFFTSAICLAIAGGAWLKNTFAKSAHLEKVKIFDGVTISEIKEDKKKELPPLPPPATKKVEVPKMKKIEFTTPIVTNNHVVEPPPTRKELLHTEISNINQEGVDNNGIVAPPENLDENKGLITVSKNADDDFGKTFYKVEIDASYAGNWKSFLERNLNGEIAVENGASPGRYTVIIQFVVDSHGIISDIQPLTNIGHGMEQEAVRVIKKSGKWKPALQNGRQVRAYKKQPIIFEVLE